MKNFNKKIAAILASLLMASSMAIGASAASSGACTSVDYKDRYSNACVSNATGESYGCPSSSDLGSILGNFGSCNQAITSNESLNKYLSSALNAAKQNLNNTAKDVTITSANAGTDNSGSKTDTPSTKVQTAGVQSVTANRTSCGTTKAASCPTTNSTKTSSRCQNSSNCQTSSSCQNSSNCQTSSNCQNSSNCQTSNNCQTSASNQAVTAKVIAGTANNASPKSTAVASKQSLVSFFNSILSKCGIKVTLPNKSSTGNTGNTSTGNTGNTSTGNTGNTSTGNTGNTSTGNTGNTSTGNTGNTGNTGSTAQSFEAQVAALVNEQRAKNGLAPLTLNTKLSEVARAKSQDMYDNKYFSHTSPVYGSPFDMMRTFGISYSTAGENIAMGYATPAAVMEGWMNSPGHRANILNASYTQIGVGYVASGNYWTQEFIG